MMKTRKNDDENATAHPSLAKSLKYDGENPILYRYEQFVLFPQCFQQTCTVDSKKPGLVWERVNSLTYNLDF